MAKKNQKVKSQNATGYLDEFSFGIKAFALASIAILLIQLLRGSNFSESFDKANYLLSIFIGFGMLVYGASSKKASHVAAGSFVLFLISFVLGVGGIEKHAPINGVILSNRLWLGFGPFVLLLAVIILPFAIRIAEWSSLSKGVKILLSAIFFINALLIIPSFWQNSASVIDPDHSEYVINEVLGPLNGNWPYSNYIPQYQTFYGFILRPFLGEASAASASNAYLIFLTILSYLSILLGVYFAWLALNKKSWILAIGLVVPFMGLTQFPNREGYLGSIAALLSGLSIRIFPGLLLFAFAYLTRAKYQKIIWRIPLGIIAGLVSWQSQDFGIAATVAIGFTFLVTEGFFNSQSWIRATSFVSGLLIGLAAYPIVGSIFGHKIEISYFLYFARQFGSGFGAEGMRTPGPVLYILPLIIMLFVTHGVLAVKQKDKKEIAEFAFIGLFMATWSMLGFLYYLNRSYASGQMQVLFLPIAISVAALVGSFNFMSSTGNVFLNSHKDNIISKRYLEEKRAFALIPIAAVVSLAFSTLLLTPNPAIEMKRINEGNSAPRWPKATVLASVKDAIAAKKYAEASNIKLAFFGASSQYVQRETGVISASILNSPFDLTMSKQTVVTSCDFIFKLNPDAIVVSDEGQALFRFENQTLCNNYKFTEVPGVRQYHYAVRI